jgi:hypothetical protein
VVNASRSILKAWNTELKNNEASANGKITLEFAAEAARRAAIEMRYAIQAAAHKQQAAQGGFIENH